MLPLRVNFDTFLIQVKTGMCLYKWLKYDLKATAVFKCIRVFSSGLKNCTLQLWFHLMWYHLLPVLENPALPVNPPTKTPVQIIEFNKEADLSSEGGQEHTSWWHVYSWNLFREEDDFPIISSSDERRVMEVKKVSADEEKWRCSSAVTSFSLHG